ncbi:MAG: DUF4347 domain-containing protein [Anaerolineae bacterium]
MASTQSSRICPLALVALALCLVLAVAVVPSSPGARPTDVVFIDASVADAAALVAGLPGDTQAIVLDADRDGLAQMAAAVQGQHGLSAIHVVAHGDSGRLLLGDGVLDAGAITGRGEQLAAIGAALADGGDLLLYGCDVAAGSEGERFVAALAQATGADVAASTGATGNAALGGDWVLEYVVGDVRAAALGVDGGLAGWDATLQAPSSESFDSILVQLHGCPAEYGDWTFRMTGASGDDTGGDCHLDIANLTSLGFSGPLSDSDDDHILSILGTLDYATTFVARSTDGSEFALRSFYIEGTAGATESLMLTGYRDGYLVVGAVIAATQGQATLVDYQEELTDPDWRNIDEFRLEPQIGEADFDQTFMDDIVVSNPLVPDSTSTVTEAGDVTEPVALPSTVDTLGEALPLFDFTITDAGTADGLETAISQIVVHTGGTGDPSKLTWLLNGPDVTNKAGTYSAGAHTITFSPLSIHVADASNEIYTISAYYTASGLVDGSTYVLSLNGSHDFTTVGDGSALASSQSDVGNGTGTTVAITATELRFTTQPAGSVSGAALTTQPVVSATDAFGNVDADFAGAIGLTEASAGTLSGTTPLSATAGVATFTNVTYTATADLESFSLTAASGALTNGTSSSVTSDVVATKLVFSVQPAPTTIASGESTAFTTVPVVRAVDAGGIVDAGWVTSIELSVTDPNDGTLNGVVTSMSGTGDTDGVSTTVTRAPSSGVTTFTSLSLQYTALAPDTIALQATSGGLTLANSSEVTVLFRDSTSTVTAAGGVTEPVALPSTLDTAGEAANVFDFTIADDAHSDGYATAISEIALSTSGTADFTKVTWRLNGPDATNVTGTYNGVADTITFSGLSISVADGSSEPYTVSAYFSSTSGLVEGGTYLLSVDANTSFTVDVAGSQMAAGQDPVTNGTGSTVVIVATELRFATQPAGSVSGAALTTQPVVWATDAYGNVDTDFAGTVTLTEASAGALSGTTALGATAGVATFTNVAYTATADLESFALTAAFGGLTSATSNSVTSDVVATRLVFTTQPVPLTFRSGDLTSFTTVPVVAAVDANDTTDTGYVTAIVLSVTDPADDTPNGTINSLTGTGDTDGVGTTVTLGPSSGVATFTGLQIRYTVTDGNPDTIALRATSGGLTTANSSSINVSFNNAPVLGNLDGDSVWWLDVGVRLDLGADATVSDVEMNALNGGLGDYSGAVLTVQRTGTALANDEFMPDPLTPFAFSPVGSTLQLGGLTFATFTSANGVLTVNFTSSGTVATTDLVQEVVRGVLYSNDRPYGRMTARFTLSDGEGSDTADVTVEAGTIWVTNSSDQSDGVLTDGVSLREAAAIAAGHPMDYVLRFDPALTGQTITLGSPIALLDRMNLETDQATGLTITGSSIGLGGNVWVHCADGDTTTIGSALTGAGGITKNGPGTLRLTGALANTYTGSTSVDEGTLELAHSAGTVAVPGSLQVGDGIGGGGSAVARLLAGSQLASTTAVTIEEDGLFDTNGYNQTVAGITITGGAVTTGTGTLTLAGNVMVTASAEPATIDGNLDLGSATRTFTVSAGAAEPDLVVNATITGGAGSGLATAGAGEFGLGGSVEVDTVSVQNGAFGLPGDVTTSGPQTYNSLVLVNDATLLCTGASQTIEIQGSVRDTGNSTLTIENTGGTVSIAGVLEASLPLSSLEVEAATLTGTAAGMVTDSITLAVGSLSLTDAWRVTDGADLVGEIRVRGLDPADAIQVGYGASGAGVLSLDEATLQNLRAAVLSIGPGCSGPITVGGSPDITGTTGSPVVKLGPASGDVVVDSDVTATTLQLLSTGGDVVLSDGITIHGDLLVAGGTLSLGAAGTVATVSIDGGLTFSSTTPPILAVDLQGTTAGSQYDQIVVGGTATLNGAPLTVTVAAPLVPAAGQSFTVISGTTAGAFAGNGWVESEGTQRDYALIYGSAILFDAASEASLDLSAASVTAGDEVTFTVTVGPSGSHTPTGNVTLTVGDDVFSVVLVGGVATYTTDELPAGDYSVQAAYGGDAYHLASTATPKPLTIDAIDQVIVFTPPPPPAEDGAPITLGGTTTSGLPLTYTSLTPIVCTVEGATVTALKSGTCTIRASQGGDEMHNAAPDVIQSFEVTAQEYHTYLLPIFAANWVMPTATD